MPTSTPRAAAQGIPAETVISEYAPGQYELTLNYRKDVLQAADDLVMLKRLVRAAARRHGVTACFMAKPIERYAGSGMHFHVSLIDAAGRNVFAEAGGESWSLNLLQALGGLVTTMAESMLVFAPHANSWRRFVSQSYAPIAPTWGVNNRSVALRIPAGDAKNRRIEHRPSGVDANPYLIAATVLAGIAKGLDERLDPGPETKGNGYEKRRDRAERDAGRLARRDRSRQGLGLPQGRRSARTCTGPSPRSSRPNICASRARSARSTITSICTRCEERACNSGIRAAFALGLDPRRTACRTLLRRLKARRFAEMRSAEPSRGVAHPG